MNAAHSMHTDINESVFLPETRAFNTEWVERLPVRRLWHVDIVVIRLP